MTGCERSTHASPLINLARIGHLDLLHDLYGELTISAIREAVWQEIVGEGAGPPGADAVKGATWIKRHAAANEQLVRAFSAQDS